jgi:hypothetical protein
MSRSQTPWLRIGGYIAPGCIGKQVPIAHADSPLASRRDPGPEHFFGEPSGYSLGTKEARFKSVLG